MYNGCFIYSGDRKSKGRGRNGTTSYLYEKNRPVQRKNPSELYKSIKVSSIH
jgi:hypothetical protein